MASTNRLLNFLFLGAIASAIGACASPAVQECGATGVLCPKGTHCAAAQGICISDTNACGNAHLDPGEVCDDGNTLDADGCSADCKSDESCGNGQIDTKAHIPEQCDDGPNNGKLGDPCSATCQFVRCGNGIVEQGEQCDDNNITSGDGCSATCQREYCGNGYIDTEAGEVCDDGDQNGKPGDPCSANCRSNLSCGNKNVDPGEECDNGTFGDGNPTGNQDSNDCRADCQFNRCGDGHIDTQPGSRHEECDDGLPDGLNPGPRETAGCNIDCTKSGCGDGKVNRAAGEQCDDGNNANNDGCSVTCQFERCGNGLLDPQEECDGTAGAQPCNLQTCLQERCGNGILDDDLGTGVHEQCDDHNTNDNDGCSSACVIESCGDGVTNNHEACDPTDPAFGQAGCNLDCTLPRCGDAIVNDQFKPNGKDPEQCDPPSVANGCSASCRFEHCGNGVVDPGEQCDDGNTAKGDGCFECRREECANGRVDPGEQCDDNNDTSGDGCSGSTSSLGACVIEFCGDSVVNDKTTHTSEACDTGGTNSATCNFNCTAPLCGDGIVNNQFKPNGTDPEQCDPPSVANGCSASCRFEHCGNGVVDPGEQCDDGNTAKGDGCFECRREECGNGRLDPEEQCDDGNTDPGDGCSPDCHFETCGNGITDPGEDCDDGTNNGKLPSQCSTTCHTIKCGNGVLEQGEECDDNNTVTETCSYGATSCKVCNATCHITDGATSFCGDGVADGTASEACDDGNTSCGACSSDCKAVTSEVALGSITVPTGDNFQTGDTFVLSDGVTVAIFEFTVILNASPAPMAPALDVIHIPITNSTLNGPELSQDIATAIADAINDPNNHLQITAQPQVQNSGTTIIGLTHKLNTSNGNQAIVSSFANPSAFQVSGMAGGEGGNCAASQACTKNADCASFQCNNIPPSVGVCL